MSDNKSYEDMTVSAEALEQPETEMMDKPTALGSGSATPKMQEKCIQIDMDYEHGEDPKKKKKYWQDLAGFRGAREEYLLLDNRDLKGDKFRQADYINYLKAKLEMAAKEIRTMKAKCRCQQPDTSLERLRNKTFSSIGL